jgi:hypothetical protein
MTSTTVHDRIHRTLPAQRLAATCADVVVEALQRMFAHRLADGRSPTAGATTADVPPLTIGVGQLVRLIGIEIREAGEEAMVADREVERALARLRGCRGRRGEAVRRLYRGVTRLRRSLSGVLGRERATRWLEFLDGETSRDPHTLIRQTRLLELFLGDPTTAPSGPVAAGVEVDWPALAAPLRPLRAELEAALRTVTSARRTERLARGARRRALARLDRVYLRGSRLLESLLDYAGLPSLAAEVRPGVGRRGRPMKERPVDEHPDLVARARAAGDWTAPATAGSGVSVPETAVEGRRGRQERSRAGRRRRSSGSCSATRAPRAGNSCRTGRWAGSKTESGPLGASGRDGKRETALLGIPTAQRKSASVPRGFREREEKCDRRPNGRATQTAVASGRRAPGSTGAGRSRRRACWPRKC